MSAPNACGSALLLIDYFERRFPHESLLSSTLKGLILHTADDLGTPGPDYRFGWGLMNTFAGADLIRDHASAHGGVGCWEGELSWRRSSRSYPLVRSGAGPVRVTLCWTDPPGRRHDGARQPEPAPCPRSERPGDRSGGRDPPAVRDAMGGRLDRCETRCGGHDWNERCR